MERADLYLMSTDAFDNREDVPQYIPIEAQISEIHVTYLWETIRLLRTIPAGTRALFVNMTEKMVREATSGLNQLGVNHIELSPFIRERSRWRALAWLSLRTKNGMSRTA